MDLRALIVQTLSEHKSPDPHEVADEVLAAIGPRDVRAVLAQLLPDAVRKVIHQQRGTAPVDAPSGNGKRAVGAMVRDPWRLRVWVPGFGWKFRGDLTADDCSAIADDYVDRSRQMQEHAARWRGLSKRLREAGVATLRDLGDDAAVAA
jgi:hypothetical protein